MQLAFNPGMTASVEGKGRFFLFSFFFFLFFFFSVEKEDFSQSQENGATER
jgi:hypothetical protein